MKNALYYKHYTGVWKLYKKYTGAVPESAIKRVKKSLALNGQIAVQKVGA